MADIISLLSLLTKDVTVSGYEETAYNAIAHIKELYFDELVCDNANNFFLIKHAKTQNAKKVLIDAHMDEVGMLVSDITDDGFLRVINVGGIDGKILQPCEVTVYGKEEIYGIVCSTPPHLKSSSKPSEMHDLFIDTGFSKDELSQKGIRIGSPISFRYHLTELQNGRLCGKGFDDKICAVCAIRIAELLSECDVKLTVMLSSREEIGKNAACGAYNSNCDYAIVLDVTGAEIPEERNSVYKSSKMGGGAEISVSAILQKPLVDSLVNYAQQSDIPHRVSCDGMNTGTNANDIPTVGYGIPTVLLSIPLANMHTYAEIIDVNDVEYTAQLTAGFIKDVIVKEAE